MFLVSEEFLATTHGKLGCISCHGGENTPDKAVAHTEMDPYPSDNFSVSCGNCHNDVTTTFGTSIHYTLGGMSNGLLEFTDFTHCRTPNTIKMFLRTTVTNATRPVAIAMLAVTKTTPMA
jgi:hypothetical protein